MKYFFLSDGWTVGRVWEFGGLWNELVWRRKPDIQKLNIGIVEQGEKLWLYRVEEAVLMLEVQPPPVSSNSHLSPTKSEAQTIGQVVLKRLMSADLAIDRLRTAGETFKIDA